jgi:hypothetical protein
MFGDVHFFQQKRPLRGILAFWQSISRILSPPLSRKGRSFIWTLDCSRVLAALSGLRQSTALHSIRILPFHLRFFVPMAELSQLRWDWAFPRLSPRDVTARTSKLPFDCAQGILNFVEGFRSAAVSRYLFKRSNK